MTGPRSSRFAAALAALALALSGNALAQQPGLPPLPSVPQPAPPVAIPSLPPAPPALLPTAPEVPLPAPPSIQQAIFRPQPAPARFLFKVEPNTPMKDLLPVAPKTAPRAGRS